MKRDNFSFYEHSPAAFPVSIVSIPLEHGSDVRGHAKAPQHLFDNGLEKMLAAVGAEVGERVSIYCPKPPLQVGAGSMKNVKEVASVAKRAAAVVEKAARRGDTVLALGGDHAAAIGSIAGAAAAHLSLGVIYIDAHPDCNTEETTISGNIHGFVTALMMGHGHPMLLEAVKRRIPPENFVYIGLKDFDQAEIEYLRANRCASVTMLDIARHGLSPALNAVAALKEKVDKVWVSMDLDSIDERYAPGVGLATPDGLTRREAMSLAQYIGSSCSLAGLDLMEIVPEKDKDNATAALALELSARFLGGEYTWYKNYMREYKETNVTSRQELA